MSYDLNRDTLDHLRSLPREGFVQEWIRLTGEPPAVMLDRETMLVILTRGQVPSTPWRRSCDPLVS